MTGTWRWRLGRAAVAAAALLWVPAPAAAHTVGDAGPTNYQTRLLTVQPPVPGVSVRVAAGDRLELTNDTRRDILVLGYDGEPYLKVGPGGAFENRRSPATWLNRTRTGTTPIPPDADPKAAPQWHQLSERAQVRWHDHRTHWMGASDPPQVQQGPGRTHTVIPRWTVTLRDGDATVTLAGDLRWVPAPPAWPWLLAAAAVAAGVVLASRRPAWPALLAGGTGALVAADVMATAAGWAASSPPLSSVLSSGAVAVLGWAAGAAAVVRLLGRRRDSGVFLALVAAALILVVGGLSDLPILLRSQLASALPDAAVRGLVTAKLGLGAGLLTAALLRVRQPRLKQTPMVASSPRDADAEAAGDRPDQATTPPPTRSGT